MRIGPYETLGHAGALADFERFLELAPDDANAPTVRKRVAELRARR